MKKIDKLKLNHINKVELGKKEMNIIKGGEDGCPCSCTCVCGCECGCQYYGYGGSSSSDNFSANENIRAGNLGSTSSTNGNGKTISAW